MLTFFRRIRKGLLNSGATRKYLVYAAGEVLLVMIGILLALQVNNWNEKRINKIEMRKFLWNLKSDVESDRIMWNTFKKNNIFRYYSLQHLLKLAADEELVLGPDETMLKYEDNDIWQEEFPQNADRKFLMLTFRWSFRVNVGKPITSSVEELKGSGMYSNLSSKVKKALDAYYYRAALRFNLGNDQGIRGEVDRWNISLEKDGVIPMDLTNVPNPLQLIKGHNERIVLVKRLIRNAWYISIQTGHLEIDAQELIGLIQQEIKNI